MMHPAGPTVVGPLVLGGLPPRPSRRALPPRRGRVTVVTPAVVTDSMTVVIRPWPPPVARWGPVALNAHTVFIWKGWWSPPEAWAG